MKYVRSFLCRSEGQGLVEYAMILGLVSLITVLTLHSIGVGVNRLVDKVQGGLIRTTARFASGSPVPTVRYRISPSPAPTLLRAPAVSRGAPRPEGRGNTSPSPPPGPVE